MKKQFLQNPENRYKLVCYTPSLSELKSMYYGMYNNYVGGRYDIFDDLMRRKGYDDISVLTNNSVDFLKVVLASTLSYSTLSYVCLKEIETGEFINRFYDYVYSYHPEEGYVILRKETDRDTWGGDEEWILCIVSLKTGKEIKGVFIVRPSGIKNKRISGVSLLHYRDGVFEIDENKGEIVELTCSDCSEKIRRRLPKANWRNRKHFGIDFIDNGIPFFEDSVYLSIVQEQEYNFLTLMDAESVINDLENQCLGSSNSPEALELEDLLRFEREGEYCEREAQRELDRDYIENIELMNLLAELEPEEEQVSDDDNNEYEQGSNVAA